MTQGAYSYERDVWEISEEEFKQLFINSRFEQMKALLSILYYTGARYNEARTLKMSNVLIEDDYITFFIKNAKRKDNTRRAIKLPRKLKYLDYFEKYYKNRELRIVADNASTQLFEFNYWKGINELRRTCKIADLKLSFHAFRKSVGTKIAERGHSAYQIQNWLGHKTPATAFYYIQNSTRVTRDITEGFKEDIK